MTRLVTEVRPNQLVSYGSLKVAFYDNLNPSYNAELHDSNSPNFVSDFPKVEQYVIYIHVINGGDDRSIVRRKFKEIRVPDGMNGNKLVSEVEIYKTAYQKYLQLKEGENVEDAEKEALKRRIKELEELGARNNEIPIKPGTKKQAVKEGEVKLPLGE